MGSNPSMEYSFYFIGIDIALVILAVFVIIAAYLIIKFSVKGLFKK